MMNKDIKIIAQIVLAVMVIVLASLLAITIQQTISVDKSTDKISEDTVHSQFKQRNLVGTAQVILVDGCEYVIYEAGYGVSIEHHGACNNPIHK